MITLQAGQTLRGVASSATTVTYTITGMELATDETYKVLVQGQFAASVGTLYTAPASTAAMVKTMHIVNTNAGATKTFTLYVGGTAATNQITPTVTLPAGGWATWSDDGWKVYDSTGYSGVAGPQGPVGPTGPFPGFKFLFNTSTAAADPGYQHMSMNNATQASATVLYFYDSDAYGLGTQGLLDVIDDSTSSAKGYIFLNNLDGSKRIVFLVNGTSVDSGTYHTVGVQYANGVGGFTAEEEVFFNFYRTGDKGDTGNTGSTGSTGSTGATGAAGPTGPAPAGQIFLSAAGMWPRTTAGCATNTLIEAGTNNVNYYVLDFDQTTQEYAQVALAMPSDWNAGTVTAVFYWTMAGASTSGVVWSLSGRSYANDDAIDQATGTIQQIADNGITAGGVHITSATPAITIAGATASEWVMFQISRVTGDASDTMTQDARLIGVMLNYTRT